MALASTPRQPFAELGAARLQSLSSAKNRQNALSDILLAGNKGKLSLTDSKRNAFNSPSKRSFALSVYEDEIDDSENVAPPSSPSLKRSKNINGVSVPKPEPIFNLSVTGSETSPWKQRTPSNSLASLPTTTSAPAGRSPKPKRVGALSKHRASLSPYRRVDPPRFGANKSKSVGVPFSLDAAISGTVSKPAPVASKVHDVPVLQDAMPKGWFFKIHEDTPDEEAAIIMEHSTCTLDISSDDEAGPRRAKDDRGKENIPPPDFAGVAAATASPAAGLKPTKPRRSVHVDAMADDGEERAPLGALPTEDFYARGLHKDSVEVIADACTAAQALLSADVESKENVDGDMLNVPVPSPTRLCSANSGGIDAGLVASKPEFVIAEDPIDAQA